MTFPALRGPWDFPCQLIGEDGRDTIKPVGTDTTRVTWVRMRVPPEYPANIWIEGNGYADLDERRATELLRNEAYARLNPAEVRRLLPPEPEPAPEEGEPVVTLRRFDPSTETMGEQRLREAAELRERIAACLRADATQSNRMIARLIAPRNKKLVIHMRRRLEASGEIERVPPSARKMGRAGRPRREA